MQKLLAKIIPFIFLGIMLVLLVVGIVFFSYLLIFGAIIGVILFLISWVKDRLFNKSSRNKNEINKNRSGRTIEHDDN
ncbi:hypothetical protein N9L02_02900 [Gammaproteobacteria bacterium]|nr:hypothetical protein [Gammaproteobacteria bacterium]